MVSRFTLLLGSLVATLPLFLACSPTETPERAAPIQIGIPTAALKAPLGRVGRWDWSWRSDAGSCGEARLEAAAGRYLWTFNEEPAETALTLVPFDGCWLTMRVPGLMALAETPPLPRLATESGDYPDLVGLLRSLTLPRFDAVVVHWPESPVPVSAPEAVSGAVDLAACLREAVQRWNEGEASPFFVWDPDATWGVRLAHYAGTRRRPPLMAQLTRRNASGQPLRVRIAAGDNYDDPEDRPYAVRGLAHELGHALLLWGHTSDRVHLLWGDAPPLVDWPSNDERRAARLWRQLPAGLDLKRYGTVTPP